jgi:hypothetical protein
MAELLITNTGMFHVELQEWKAKPADDKTWKSFQTFFPKAHRQWRSQKDTAQQVGYHGANATFRMETVEAIANLADHVSTEAQTKDTILQD